MNIILIVLVTFLSLKLSSASLRVLINTENNNIFLPNTWSSITECPVRYYDLGHDGAVAPAFGSPAYNREYAHMAAIGWKGDDDKISWKCGGSLVSEMFILTAGHCGYYRGKAPSVARMGDLNLERDDDDKYAQQIEIEKVILHPDYEGSSTYNDLALLKLKEPIKLHPVVCPACLWINSTINFKSVEACGYGQTGFFEEQTPQLLKVTLSPVHKDLCSEYYGPERKLKNGLIDSQICARDPALKQDTCPGDSGSGLQIKLLGYARMNPFIIGVTSFGKSCGTETPGVYTRVSSYIDWIEAETGEDFDPLKCSFKYAEYREYEPDIILYRTKDNLAQYHDGTKVHFSYTNDTLPPLAFLGSEDCIGVFIHEEYLLTTSSCVINGSAPKNVVVTSNPNKIYGVAEVFTHPLYRLGNLNHDIALIKLLRPAEFERDGFAPACLWSKELPKTELEIHGYGPYGIHSLFLPEKLEEVLNRTYHLRPRTSEISFSDCWNYYENDKVLLTENSACYGNLSLYIIPESCQLYIGAPVTREYYGTLFKYHTFVFGVNSFGNDCGFGYPVVATKVANYIDWIDSIVFGVSKRGQPCKSPLGQGKCLPASECQSVITNVRNGGNLNNFICNFEDASNPSVCCPRFQTALDDCPKLYKTYRGEDRNVKTHLVVIDADTKCYGALISDGLVLTSSRCGKNSSSLTIGDCESKITAETMEVNEISSSISLIVLKENVKISSCTVPICLWTDPDRIPFVLTKFPETDYVIPYHAKEKCQKTLVDDDDDMDSNNLGCATYVDYECKLKRPEVIQAVQNETNLAVPYLIGIGTVKNKCESGKQTFYYEKISSVVDEILKYF